MTDDQTKLHQVRKRIAGLVEELLYANEEMHKIEKRFGFRRHRNTEKDCEAWPKTALAATPWLGSHVMSSFILMSSHLPDDPLIGHLWPLAKDLELARGET